MARNRNDQLIIGPKGIGVRCDWKWTSPLYIARVFPFCGRLLMSRAMKHWPIELSDEPTFKDSRIKVSFIIGHRGFERLPLLLLTLKSIAAQKDISFECIVVEQAIQPEIKSSLPKWVRYLFTPLPDSDMPYSRSWTFNVAARHARGELLIFHDNDMLVPTRYTQEMWKIYNEGYEIINLKRFVFYLKETATSEIIARESVAIDSCPGMIIQNLEAGGSFGTVRETYEWLGGFDEAFVGWGGEDNEYWERALTRRTWNYGYVPIIHLWHEAQPEKLKKGRSTKQLYNSRSSLPVAHRIRELRSRSWGDPVNLDPPYTTASVTQELS